MRAFPVKDLNIAVLSEIKRLGYKTSGTPKKGTPIVFVEQFNLSTPTHETKDSTDYEVTFVIDVVTRECSHLKGYEIIEDIRSNLVIEVAGYCLQDTAVFEECLSADEFDEEAVLQRQTQRVRVLLTTKID